MTGGTVVVAHPSADVYGADLQLLQSVQALVRTWRVVVAIPSDGPLVDMIIALGAEVFFVDFPVLRKSALSGHGLARLSVKALRAVRRLSRFIEAMSADVVYVNTVTLPWWLAAARLQRRPVVCHVHEAETEGRRSVRFGLIAPLYLATSIIVISRASLAALVAVAPRLERRATLVYNGVPEPTKPLAAVAAHRPARLLVVGRLSPRKAPDVALEVLAELRLRGYDVELEVAGTPFDGYEWYEQKLRDRASRPDLAGWVVFSGYVSPVWTAIERAQVIIQPSPHEPFGLVVVEAQLGLRPVVAAAAKGHLESIVDGETGLLAPAGDVSALADQVARLLDDPILMERLARTSWAIARQRFSLARYRDEIRENVEAVSTPSTVARGLRGARNRRPPSAFEE